MSYDDKEVYISTLHGIALTCIRGAFCSPLRRFSSPAGQRWQRRQALPLRQPWGFLTSLIIHISFKGRKKP